MVLQIAIFFVGKEGVVGVMAVRFSFLLATFPGGRGSLASNNSFLEGWEAETRLLVLMWLCRMPTILSNRIFSNVMAALYIGLQKNPNAFYLSLGTLLKTAK